MESNVDYAADLLHIKDEFLIVLVSKSNLCLVFGFRGQQKQS